RRGRAPRGHPRGGAGQRGAGGGRAPVRDRLGHRPARRHEPLDPAAPHPPPPPLADGERAAARRRHHRGRQPVRAPGDGGHRPGVHRGAAGRARRRGAPRRPLRADPAAQRAPPPRRDDGDGHRRPRRLLGGHARRRPRRPPWRRPPRALTPRAGRRRGGYDPGQHARGRRRYGGELGEQQLMIRLRALLVTAMAVLVLGAGAASAQVYPPPPPPPPPPPAGFVDVPASAYYALPVNWAKANGVTTGVGGTNRFEPHRPITRAEMVTFMWRAAGKPSAGSSGFVDVPA